MVNDEAVILGRVCESGRLHQNVKDVGEKPLITLPADEVPSVDPPHPRAIDSVGQLLRHGCPWHYAPRWAGQIEAALEIKPACFERALADVENFPRRFE
eukprot:CAMPEP_0119306972 /NCGR_PEP_ID=MMETSP1333-20130426/7598_1 /TAXON_ID=418940 /ORGANISM="Scyphosphaera apsteinii, Strain RCC1455" /LENGTH=98 /DNA_ID=CAMNT_0007310415 /DNA_START=456 /DNA_END=752 /DNA_ORIENTATION=-